MSCRVFGISGSGDERKRTGAYVRFERIHPFAGGNVRIGWLNVMKECLRFGITPFIIGDKNRTLYQYGILAWSQDHVPMMSLVQSAQERFQAKIELCKLFQYARYPEPYQGGKR